jgi:hypothetical protein
MSEDVFQDGENMAALFEQIMSGSFEFADPYWTDISAEGTPKWALTNS